MVGHIHVVEARLMQKMIEMDWIAERKSSSMKLPRRTGPMVGTQPDLESEILTGMVRSLSSAVETRRDCLRLGMSGSKPW